MKFCYLLVFCLLLISLPALSDKKPTYYIYLAGPEVFLPEPVIAGESKKTRIQELNEGHNWPFQLVGLYPLDNDIPDFAPDFETGIRVYEANIELMNRAHCVAANMVRFRGPSMDVGTAFEMGYMRGLGKPVFAYYEAEPFYGKPEEPGIYAKKVSQYYQVSPDNPHVDAYGQSIEDFNMPDNLMVIGALGSGVSTIAEDFDTAIMQIAKYLMLDMDKAN